MKKKTVQIINEEEIRISEVISGNPDRSFLASFLTRNLNDETETFESFWKIESFGSEESFRAILDLDRFEQYYVQLVEDVSNPSTENRRLDREAVLKEIINTFEQNTLTYGKYDIDFLDGDITLEKFYNFYDRQEDQISSGDISEYDVLSNYHHFLNLKSPKREEILGYNNLEYQKAYDYSVAISNTGNGIRIKGRHLGNFGGLLGDFKLIDYYYNFTENMGENIQASVDGKVIEIKASPAEIFENIDDIELDKVRLNGSFTKNIVLASAFGSVVRAILEDKAKRINLSQALNTNSGLPFEIVSYKLEKKRKRSVEQSHIFINSGDLEYFDNQIGYNAEYDYIVYADCLIPVINYNLTFKTSAGRILETREANIQIDSSVNFMIARIPMTTFEEVYNIDTPPPPPDAKFFYFEKTSELGISLQPSVGDFYEEPIDILPEDNLINRKMLSAQESTDGKINYSFDDTILFYEILVAHEEPRDYKDFELFRRVSTSRSSKYFGKFEIDKDTQIYYCFRAIDRHDNMSNPTDIVKIYVDRGELVKESFTFRKTKITEKSFIKMMHIKPSFRQLSLNTDNSKFDNIIDARNYDAKNVKLGESEDSIWGKDFIIKIKSRSGKIIKFRINFDYEYKN